MGDPASQFPPAPADSVNSASAGAVLGVARPVGDPYPFAEIRSLWIRLKEIFGDPPPPTSASAEAPEPTPEAQARKLLLVDLQGLSGALLDRLQETKGGAEEPKDCIPAELQKLGADSVVAATCSDERARPVLEAMGYTSQGAVWQLDFARFKLPLLRAANHFVEALMGLSPNDPDGTGFGGGMPLGMMGMMGVPQPNESTESPQDPGVDLDLDKLIAQVREKWMLPNEAQVKTLCHRARKLFSEEDNILEVKAPCTIVGDIHGQFWDLLFQVLEKGGDPAETTYVFLGDFVDRGENSLLCMVLILLYKCKYPERITILRGNHESRITNTIYGFHEECRTLYPEALGTQSSLQTGRLDSQIWTLFNHMFDAFPVAALIGGRIFCCHGGLSPQLPFLERVLTFDRQTDIMPQGPMADLTWSDPGASTGWRLNVRGSGHMFGVDITQEFCKENNLMYVCRAHQCVKQGYKWDQENKVVTVFSAPNYCWAQNKGAIMKLDEDLKEQFIVYDQAEKPETQPPPPDSVPQAGPGGAAAEYFKGDGAEGSGGQDAAAAAAPAKTDADGDTAMTKKEEPASAEATPAPATAPTAAEGAGAGA